MIGYEAGQNNQADGNIFLGYNAGKNETGSNKLYIENSSATSPLIYGEFDNDLLRINGTLNINNAFSFPTTDGTNGEVLQTDGSGTLSWTNISSTITPAIVQDADNDTKIQVEESSDEDIIRFDIGGNEYFTMNTGRLQTYNTGNSVFVGQEAGLNDDLTANQNVAIGDFAAKEITTGDNNVTIGFQAMNNSSTDASANTVIGAKAASNNTTSSVTAIGFEALRDQTNGFANTALGARALLTTTGGGNIGVGYEAGKFQKTGTYNVYLGHEAGEGSASYNASRNVVLGAQAGLNIQGSYNVFIGSEAGFNETGSNRLYIENSNSTSPLIYGEFDNDLVRINGTLNINNAFSLPTTDGLYGQFLQTDGSGNLTWTNTTIIQDADFDTKIQVEKNTDEDIIRFDIGGNEQFKMENSKFTVAARGLSGSDIDLVFNSNTYISGNTIKNEIKNILPSSFNAVASDYKMTFNVNGNNALTLDGMKNVKISDSYTLPNTDGTANQILTTNGSGTASWSTQGDFSENIQLNGNYLSNDGGNEGISIDNSGNATVSGTLKIGNTSAISGIIKHSESRNIGNISGNSSQIETFTVSGASTDGVVYVSTSGQLQSQIVIAQAWVSSTNTVSVRFRNTDGGSQNPDGSGMTYRIVVIQ